MGRRWAIMDANGMLVNANISKYDVCTLKVSSVPATRQDVSNLQEMLDTRLQQTQARETGICPVRRELYRQCFGTQIVNKEFLLNY